MNELRLLGILLFVASIISYFVFPLMISNSKRIAFNDKIQIGFKIAYGIGAVIGVIIFIVSFYTK